MEESPNLSYVREIGGEDRDFAHRYIKLLKEEFQWEVGMYLRHINKKQPKQAAEIVASSKYKLRILGLERAFNFAIEYEKLLRLGDSSRDIEFRKILTTVSNFLRKI